MPAKLRVANESVVERLGAITAFERVYDPDVTHVVYSRKSSKTGIRRGVVVGQIPCVAWFYRKVEAGTGNYSREHGLDKHYQPRWFTRKACVDALLKGEE